jgi:folylpolyglutamate synthase/dihydropteroate synthase
MDRMRDAADIAAAARAAAPQAAVAVEADPGHAIDRARAGARGTVLVAGSLFLAGAARRHLCGDAADPVFLSDPVKLPR